MNAALLKVLLVEDSPSDVQLFQERLEEAGPQGLAITYVECLRDALEHAQGETFDVLLLDLNLPDSSGHDTFERARAQLPHLPIIVLTGLDDEALGVEALRHGIQDYLVKGQTNGRQILRAIRYAIERHRAEEQIQRHVEELRVRNEETLRLNRAMVGRELRMIELKKEVNELCAQVGQPPRYPLAFEKKPPENAQ